MYDSEKKKKNFWKLIFEMRIWMCWDLANAITHPCQLTKKPLQSLGTNSMNHGEQRQSQVSVKSV